MRRFSMTENKDYKRAYKYTNKYGTEEYLFEERRGDSVRGADQGYVEADWKMTIKDAHGLGLPIIKYKIIFGWGNDGPYFFNQWDIEEDYDNPDYMTEAWIAERYEVITDEKQVEQFIRSRPGLYEQLYDEGTEA
jgi:hypothetical protein